jgi:hypothetical protein
MVVTIMGWGLVIKSTLYLTYPKHGMRILSQVNEDRSFGFVIAGVVAVGLSGLIAFSLFNS